MAASGIDTKAVAENVAANRDAILSAIPAGVELTLEKQDALFKAIAASVVHYVAWKHTGSPRRRQHRRTKEQKYSAAPGQVEDAPRQSLIGDLFDAYMSIRGDELESRGFKAFADTVLRVAGLPLSMSITDNDRTSIRKRVKPFNSLAAEAFAIPVSAATIDAEAVTFMTEDARQQK